MSLQNHVFVWEKSLPSRAVIKSTVLQLTFATLSNLTMFKVNTWKDGNQVRAYLTNLFGYCIYCKIGQYCLIVICKSEGISKNKISGKYLESFKKTTKQNFWKHWIYVCNLDSLKFFKSLGYNETLHKIGCYFSRWILSPLYLNLVDEMH